MKYQCDNCNRTFNEPQSYPRNIQRPEQIEFYSCPYCGSDNFIELTQP